MMSNEFKPDDCPNCYGWGKLVRLSKKKGTETLKCKARDDFASSCGHRFERKSYEDGVRFLTDLDSE